MKIVQNRLLNKWILGVIVIQLQSRRYVAWTYLMVQTVSLAMGWQAATPIYIASKDQQPKIHISSTVLMTQLTLKSPTYS